MKELKNEMLKLIVKVGGADKLLNMHLTQLYTQFRSVFGDEVVIKVQNAHCYFLYSDQGKARVEKALAK